MAPEEGMERAIAWSEVRNVCFVLAFLFAQLVERMTMPIAIQMLLEVLLVQCARFCNSCVLIF